MRSLLLVLVCALTVAGVATATAPPVGPLPPGPVSTITTTRGQYVAFALPHRPHGRVWRAATYPGAKVMKPIQEADVGSTVVLTYRAVGRGKVTLKFALTRGETRKAYESRTYVVTVK